MNNQFNLSKKSKLYKGNRTERRKMAKNNDQENLNDKSKWGTLEYIYNESVNYYNYFSMLISHAKSDEILSHVEESDKLLLDKILPTIEKDLNSFKKEIDLTHEKHKNKNPEEIVSINEKQIEISLEMNYSNTHDIFVISNSNNIKMLQEILFKTDRLVKMKEAMTSETPTNV